MDLVERLDGLFNVFQAETKNIVNCIKSGTEYTSEVFDMPIIMDDEERPWNLRGRHGVYVFMVVEDVQLTIQDVHNWRNAGGAGLKSSLPQTLHSGDCLYVGSCVSKDNSLYVRIRQHFAIDGTFTALKLRNKDRKILYKKVKAYIYPARKEYENYYRVILTSIEKNLHIQLLPRAGCSRV